MNSTTRPTSTNLHWLVLTSASPIMSIDTGSEGGALAVILAGVYFDICDCDRSVGSERTIRCRGVVVADD